jgi:hypothetical protein
MNTKENKVPDLMNRPKQNPFRTPEYYFETIEDKVMSRIASGNHKKSTRFKVIQFLKPALGLAASFTLVYFLVAYPIKHFLPKSMVKSESQKNITTDIMDAYSVTISEMNETSFVEAILNEEYNTNASQIDSEELLAYLSTEMNELELYNEFQN